MKLRKATIDHSQPTSRGGTDDAENLVLACTACNAIKADRTPDEWARDIIEGPVTRRNALAEARENPVPLAQDLADSAVIEELSLRPIAIDEGEDRADAYSLAWEFARRGQTWKLALWYAWRDVKQRGRVSLFRESRFSVTSNRTSQSHDRPRRKEVSEIQFKKIPDRSDGSLRADVTEWIESLDPDAVRAVELAAAGRRLHRSSARMLMESWRGFSDTRATRPAVTTEDALDRLRARVQNEGDALTDSQRGVLTMLLSGQFTTQAVADYLGISVTATCALRVRGLKAIRATEEERRGIGCGNTRWQDGRAER